MILCLHASTYWRMKTIATWRSRTLKKFFVTNSFDQFHGLLVLIGQSTLTRNQFFYMSKHFLWKGYTELVFNINLYLILSSKFYRNFWRAVNLFVFYLLYFKQEQNLKNGYPFHLSEAVYIYIYIQLRKNVTL